MNCTNCGQPIGAESRFCGDCGTALTVTPIEVTLHGEQRTVVPPPPRTADVPVRPDASVSPRRPLGNPLRLVALAAAAIGVVVVAMFVVQALRGKDGAGSPEAAVTRLTKAVDQQDAVGILNAINPGEVHDLASVYREARGRLGKSGYGKGSNVETALLGLQNVHFVNPEFDVEKLAPDVARVTLVSGALEFDQLTRELDAPNFGSLRSGEFEPSTSGYQTRHRVRLDARHLEYHTTDSNGFERTVEPFLMAVRNGGGWYVSLTYTAAEEAVRALGLPEPTFGSSTSSVDSKLAADATSPEATIRGIARAISSQDVGSGAPYLSPDEMRAARDYAPSFQSLIRQNADSIGQVDIALDILRTSPERADGGFVKVNIDRATGSVVSSNSEEPTNFDWDGSCLNNASDFNGDTQSYCLDNQFSQLTGINKLFVLMKHTGSRYTVSPIATALAYLKLASDHISDATIQRVTNSYATAATSGELTPGRTTNGRTNDSGFAVYTFEGTKGRTIGFNTQDGSTGSYVDYQVVDPDGREVGSNSYPAAYRLPKNGKYRVAVIGPRFERTPFIVRLQVR